MHECVHILVCVRPVYLCLYVSLSVSVCLFCHKGVVTGEGLVAPLCLSLGLCPSLPVSVCICLSMCVSVCLCLSPSVCLLAWRLRGKTPPARRPPPQGAHGGLSAWPLSGVGDEHLPLNEPVNPARSTPLLNPDREQPAGFTQVIRGLPNLGGVLLRTRAVPTVIQAKRRLLRCPPDSASIGRVLAQASDHEEPQGNKQVIEPLCSACPLPGSCRSSTPTSMTVLREKPRPGLPPHLIPNRNLAQHCLCLPTPNPEPHIAVFAALA